MTTTRTTECVPPRLRPQRAATRSALSEALGTGSLGAQAAAAGAACFRGRHREISRFVDLLRDPACLPHYLYVTGPVGIGKTALIRAVRRRITAERVGDVVVIDASEFGGNPALFEQLVRARAAPWPRTADDAPLVLFIDGYERVGLHDRRRLRETFMASMTGPVLLAVCERQLPRDFLIQWLGWRSVIEEIPLKPLSPEDAAGVVSAQGWSADDADEVAGLTGGSPLLMALAGMIVPREPATQPLHHRFAQEATRRRFAQEATRLLFARLGSETVNIGTRSLVELVALFPVVSEEALAAMAGAGLREHIGQFAALSIVELEPVGYAIAEPFRSLLALDLRSRRPHWCAEAESAALSAPGGDRGAEPQPGDVAGATASSALRKPPSVSPEMLDFARHSLEWLRDESVHGGSHPPAAGLLIPAATSEQLRARMTAIIGTLCASNSPRVAEAGRLLRSYHLKGSPSFEALAERMNLSRATMFRRLHLGIELVAERLSDS